VASGLTVQIELTARQILGTERVRGKRIGQNHSFRVRLDLHILLFDA
jgi:hypothetical protein